MNIDLPTALETAAGAITAFGGLYTGYRHIRYSLQAKKDKERQAILDQANEEMKKIREELEEKIDKLELELENQKISINQDLSHFREIHSSEVKNLGEKIENLRYDLTQQHQALLELLTKLVTK